jgi:hypothetical protein
MIAEVFAGAELPPVDPLGVGVGVEEQAANTTAANPNAAITLDLFTVGNP